ncbi:MULTISPECIES: histidine kinase [unclassified Paenibacillus]|uniref:sensor histidine kinase n=1 Tax=unclassified Paenibacillus TaxID=185978 RepID=UPI0009541CE0|nr:MULTISPECIES: histidine kinase [unclassified Paenibacillus]SIR44892.1 two-component system, sensor histidine kinase YesM [Paenibacillus sp. RU4X]SIR54533.1 two-component system, sensor histidine kinase YesM [Paenibacillus sp. RU4T]
MLRSRFMFSSLRKRIMMLLTVGLVGCAVLMASVSYNAIYTMQRDKIKTSMAFDLHQQTSKVNQMYSSLLQVTQQMTPEGTVGNLMETYISATDTYSQRLLSRDISYNIGLITFSNPAMELVMYYDPASGNASYSNLPLRGGFTRESLPDVAGMGELRYQSPHKSLCRFSDDQVVSVTREIRFSDGTQLVVYVEARSDMITDMNSLAESLNIPYTLIFTDRTGSVTYSSNSTAYAVGQQLRLSGPSGMSDGYVWNRMQGEYGYDITLLLPVSSYNHELYTWKNHMYWILAVALLMMFMLTLLLRRLINRPFLLIEKEMRTLGKGYMGTSHYHTGIDEFDRIFDQFNVMKRQIQQLLLDVEQKEKRRHQLEIEKLAYQINPHFLMNTLNSVRWLAVMHKQAEIERFVSSLIFLLSYNLGKSEERATFRSEIEVMRTYLELQQMRHDFEVELAVAEGPYLDSPVARFILQPIVENAVCHGLDDHGKLEIGIWPDETAQMVRIVIRDDGKGLSQETLALLQRDTPDQQQTGWGIGLRYVRSMLESFYGYKARMAIESTPNQGTTVTLELPFLHPRKESAV